MRNGCELITRVSHHNHRHVHQKRRIKSRFKSHEMHTVVTARLKTRFRQCPPDKDAFRIGKVEHILKTALQGTRVFVKLEPLGRFLSKNSQGIKPLLRSGLRARCGEVFVQRLNVRFRSRDKLNPAQVQKRNLAFFLSRVGRGFSRIHGHLARVKKTAEVPPFNLRVKGGAYLTDPRLTYRKSS